MQRSILKQAEEGSQIVKKHRQRDLDFHTLQNYVDAKMDSEVLAKNYLQWLLEVITESYYAGLAVGTRTTINDMRKSSPQSTT